MDALKEPQRSHSARALRALILAPPPGSVLFGVLLLAAGCGSDEPSRYMASRAAAGTDSGAGAGGSLAAGGGANGGSGGRVDAGAIEGGVPSLVAYHDLLQVGDGSKPFADNTPLALAPPAFGGGAWTGDGLIGRIPETFIGFAAEDPRQSFELPASIAIDSLAGVLAVRTNPDVIVEWSTPAALPSLNFYQSCVDGCMPWQGFESFGTPWGDVVPAGGDPISPGVVAAGFVDGGSSAAEVMPFFNGGPGMPTIHVDLASGAPLSAHSEGMEEPLLVLLEQGDAGPSPPGMLVTFDAQGAEAGSPVETPADPKQMRCRRTLACSSPPCSLVCAIIHGPGVVGSTIGARLTPVTWDGTSTTAPTVHEHAEIAAEYGDAVRLDMVPRQDGLTDVLVELSLGGIWLLRLDDDGVVPVSRVIPSLAEVDPGCATPRHPIWLSDQDNPRFVAACAGESSRLLVQPD